jgi:PKD repeat protein
MTNLKYPIILWLLFMPFLLSAVEWHPLHMPLPPELSRELRQAELYTTDAAATHASLIQHNHTGPLRWTISGREVQLHLVLVAQTPEFITLTGGSRRESQRDLELSSYTGRTPQGGRVRLTVSSDFIFGFWEEAGRIRFVQPLRHFVPGAPVDQYVIYDTADVIPVTEGHCGWSQAHHLAEEMTTQQQSSNTCYEVEIAIASDYTMYQHFGSATAVHQFVAGVLNSIHQNFDDEFMASIRFRLKASVVAVCPSCDPWTSSDDPNELLLSFKNWGSGGGFGTHFDVATLWTNRDLSSNTIGLAWISGLCGFNRYNILQRFISNAELLRVLQAHELGHNFGLGHDPTGSATIMAPAVSTTNDWSANSIAAMNINIGIYAGNNNCFSTCAEVDVRPTAMIQRPNPTSCPGGLVPLIDASTGNPTAWSWTMPGASPGFSNQQHPVVTYSTPGVFPVTLIASNNFGSDTITTSITVNEQGQRFVLYETFESGLQHWTVLNPHNDITWGISETGGVTHGRRSAFLNGFNYETTGRSDGLISPTFSLAASVGPILNIDYAYRRRNTTNSEQLRVWLSTDGGATFPHLLYAGQEAGNNNFVTGNTLNGPFIPASPGDWCYTGNPGTASCLSLNLQPFVGFSNVKIMIECVNAGNNNLFVDNVRIEVLCEQIPPPVAAISASPVVGCAPLNVTFQDASSGIVSARNWTFPGGSPSQSALSNLMVAYTQAGLYNVTLNVSNSSGSSQVTEPALIRVNAIPAANFSFIANGNIIQFSNTSQGNGILQWQFGDGQTGTGTNPTHIYSQPGTYVVRLTVTNECGQSTREIPITIAAPQAAFSVQTSSGCAPLSVQFQNNTPTATGFFWQFPGGIPAFSSTQHPTVVYTSPGNYDVQLIAYNGMFSDTLRHTAQIQVAPPPTASFLINHTPGTSVATFTHTASHATAIQWLIAGNVHADSILTVNFPADGDYTIQLIAVSPCGTDTATQTITIATPPMADFSTTDGPFCIPTSIQFNSAASLNTNAHEWSFPGANPAFSTALNPVVNYTEPGEHEIRLIVRNYTGTDTLIRYISTLAQPIADIRVQTEGTLALFDTDIIDGASYFWTFGDGNFSTDPITANQYEADGLYEVILRAENECGIHYDTLLLTIASQPVAAFHATNRQGCAPLSVAFQNLSSANAQQYFWSFPGAQPSSSTAANPVVSYTQAGLYPVTLTAINSTGSDTTTHSNYIHVSANPDTGFSYQINTNGSVAFSPAAAPLPNNDFFWFFGDGNFSAQPSPVHQYTLGGSYQVQLIVRNECGTTTTTDTLMINVTSTRTPVAHPSFVLYPNPANNEVVLQATPLSAGPWSFRLMDALGRTIHQQTLYPMADNTLSHRFYVHQLPAGTYFYTLNGGQETSINGKLIVVH